MVDSTGGSEQHVAVEYLRRAKELTCQFPDEIRHVVVGAHNDDLSALAFAADEMAHREARTLVKAIIETAFVLGYNAGRKDGVGT